MLQKPLAPLAAWPQFVAWRLEWNAEREKWDKIPYSPKGFKSSSTDPSHWGTYEQARAFADANGMAGIGFVFTDRDPFFFADIDGALVDGQWSQLAQEACARFPGAAVEVSQSGTGLHIIGRYTQRPEHSKRNIPLHLELYTSERFVALTGAHAVGSVDTVHDAALAAYAAQFFPPKTHATDAGWTTAPDPEWSGPTDDDQLIDRALRSSNRSAAAAFGGPDDGKVSFADLWAGNVEALARKWPSNIPGGDFDHSSADQSLANALAFWAGRDCERIERLMRMSALARPKWDDRAEYLQTTILKARQLVTSVYKAPAEREPVAPPPPPSEEVAAATGFRIRQGHHLMGHDDQMKYFNGCVYVAGPHRVLTPRGDKLDQGRFDAMFGGSEFILSPDGKKTTTSAWAAFTNAQSFVPTRADRFCFRPEAGSGGVLEESGLLLANTYVAYETASTEGDPSKYLDLVAKQLPDPRDREILLTYMASCVQNPGMKAQWWPVLQGVQGNAKTLHLSVMLHCIGLRYCHLPNTEKMVRNGMNFNGWIEGKLFVGLEEVYAADRRQFFEGFKTTVTNRYLPIEGKGLEEDTRDNRANGVITTNHRDGVPIDEDQRRYAPMFTAQQHKPDLARDGMTPRYFADLHDWFYGRNAYAAQGFMYGARVINHYLRTKVLDADLDPNQMAINAPRTSSTQAAITSSLGRIEQEILEAVGEERPGFAGGWVSSIKLDDMLERRRLSVPRAKRRELLQRLGYDWHPALEATAGRLNNVVQPDNGKPRLFCKVGSLAWNNLTEPASVAKAYSDAQARAVTNSAEAAFGKS